MRVTILGSGTAVPRPGRFPAGYLVEVDDRRLLVDLGPGVLRRVAETGLDLDRIDGVLLTHFHTDHCADVAALLFGLRNPRYAGRPRLEIVAAKGLRELVAHLTRAWRWLEPRGYELELREIDPGAHEIAGIGFEAIAIEHTAASLGYRLRSRVGTVAAFSGDAEDCPALADLARDADLFICDAAFPAAMPGLGHATPDAAGRAARAGRARHLVLTHFYPECDGHDLLAEAAVEFDGPITLAEDLTQFELGPAPA